VSGERPPTFSEWLREGFEEEAAALEGTAELRGLPHPDEHKATALLPGDDPANHLFPPKENGFLHCPVANLKAMLQTGELSREDERLVRQALLLKQQQANDVMDGGAMPGRPAPSSPELVMKPPRRSY
jgi:hypothetical protein